MIYLSDSSSAQTFTFIPRSFVINARLEITDEETGITQNNNVAISRLSGYAAINVALTLVENKFYEVKIVSIGSNWDDVEQFWNLTTINWEDGITRSGSAWNFATNSWNETTGNWDTVRQPKELVIYKDRLFCTNQTLSQGANEYYDVDKGVYKHTTLGTNKYKVYNA
jgi:hypothetical protein|tara:strand:+ start:654 stop:1157 length:504 start_codon:yes stop_codon:yes gene_type:complete